MYGSCVNQLATSKGSSDSLTDDSSEEKESQLEDSGSSGANPEPKRTDRIFSSVVWILIIIKFLLFIAVNKKESTSTSDSDTDSGEVGFVIPQKQGYRSDNAKFDHEPTSELKEPETLNVSIKTSFEPSD